MGPQVAVRVGRDIAIEFILSSPTSSCSHVIDTALGQLMTDFMGQNGVVRIKLKVVNSPMSDQMAFKLLWFDNMKNLSPIDIVFLCLTTGIAVFAMVCVVLMGS